MADSWYEVEIDLGGYVFTIESGGDQVSPVVGIGPLSGMRIGWRFPDDAPRPAQPEPMTASLQILRRFVVDFDALDIGTHLSIKVRLAPGGPDRVTFYGRVTDLQVQPHREHGTLWSILAVGYTGSELAELEVGDTPWPAEGTRPRVERILEAAGITVNADTWPTGGLPGIGEAPVAARDVDSQPALALLEHYLGQYAQVDGGSTLEGYRRLIAAPIVQLADIADPQESPAWCFDPVGSRVNAVGTPLPGDLYDVGGKWALLIFVDPERGAIDAGKVDVGVTWTRNKFGSVSVVRVSGLLDGVQQVVTAQNLELPPVRQSFDVSLTAKADAEAMATMYLPDVPETRRWTVDGFRWHLHADPDGQADFPIVFPDESLSPTFDPPERRAAYTRSLVVVGIPVAQNLGTRDYYAGQLKSCEFVIDRQKCYLDFELTPTVARPAVQANPTSYLAWEHFDSSPTLNGTTWADLYPDDTWYMYRLARRPADA